MQSEIFQYMTKVVTEREMEYELNELGRAGWELITANWEEYSYGGRSHYQARCILKRRGVSDDEFSETLRGVFSAS